MSNAGLAAVLFVAVLKAGLLLFAAIHVWRLIARLSSREPFAQPRKDASNMTTAKDKPIQPKPSLVMRKAKQFALFGAAFGLINSLLFSHQKNSVDTIAMAVLAVPIYGLMLGVIGGAWGWMTQGRSRPGN